MSMLLIPCGFLLACSLTEIPESVVAQATVNGSTLISKGFPEGTIRVDSTTAYVGSEAFVLGGSSRCEFHLYVAADEHRRVLRLYWIQFEGKLPSFIPRSYDYSDEPYRTVIGKHEFFDGVRYYNVAASRPEWNADSDIQRVLNLLEREGYHLNDDVMRIRLVRLDESKQQELMVIYLEDLAQHGLSLAAFEGASGALKWQEASEGLRTRSLAGLIVDME